MKRKEVTAILVLALGLMVCLVRPAEAEPMGTAWTYQGRLMDANSAADGLYDFVFGLFDGPEGAGELGVQVIHDLDVISGYFTVDLDFGSDVFDGSERWLQIEIRPGELQDPNEYTILGPRQRIAPTPYALQTRGIFVDDVPYIIGYPDTWTPKESNRMWRSVAMSADGTKQTAVGNNLLIYVSADSGNTWTAKESYRWWYSVAMSADGTIQTAVAYAGQIYVSTDSGNTWTPKESDRYWRSVAMSEDGTKQTAVGLQGQIYVSTDSGNTWTAKESDRNWYSVAMSADGTKQTAVGQNTLIYVSTDSGNTWTAKESNRNWWSVAMSADGTKQTAVVVNGQIYVSTDSGNTWTAKESNRAWYSVAMSADGTIQTAVVNNGQVYVSMDSGNTWTAKESNRWWYSVAMSADGIKQTAVVDQGQIYVCSADVSFAYNVGIGTISPTAKLHIAGTPGVDGIMFPDGSLQTSAGGGGGGDGHSLDAADGDPIDAVYVDNEGNVGIGTTTPNNKLEVSGASSTTPPPVILSVPLVEVIDNGTSDALSVQTSGGTAVRGLATATGSGINSGGYFLAHKDEGRGVEGVGSGTNGRGVYGWAWGSYGRGVYGEATATGDVHNQGGEFKAAGDSAYGVSGRATATGNIHNQGGHFEAAGNNAYGVYGEATGRYGVGAYGLASNSGDYKNWGGLFRALGDRGVGVLAEGGLNGYAGYFEGTGYFSGKVGIGTESPAEMLHINKSSGSLGMRVSSDATSYQYMNFGATNGYSIGRNPDDKFFINRDEPLGSGVLRLLTVQSDGNVGIGTNEPNEKLDVAGTVQCQILKITGGSDMAEPFDVKETDVVEAGMVLSIDSENAGKLKISQKAYDRCVAGIISGAGGVEPGMLMTQSGSMADGDYPVALNGRVYCFADASYGKIHPGDLLTTSDTPGHAMKVTDYNKAQGAVLGKAMTKLDQGRDLVLVLVTLQ